MFNIKFDWTFKSNTSFDCFKELLVVEHQENVEKNFFCSLHVSHKGQVGESLGNC